MEGKRSTAEVQTITPYLLYDDAAAAVDFLSRAFGFEEKRRNTGPDGAVKHAERPIAVRRS